jgi:UDP-N-acetylmuramoyl-tripeptide--D-alanyl-D-alanine ligase
MLSISQIVEYTNGKLLNGDLEKNISSVHFDTRKLKTNSLFVALTSGTRDGHEFVASAIEKGAIAVLISNETFVNEQFDTVSFILVDNTEQAFQQLAKHYRGDLMIPLIAVTGSNGKTTTKDMIAHLISGTYQTYKTEGNLNNHLGVPVSLLQVKEDTEALVIEHGMNHAGEIDFLASISCPDISIITNIGDSHIEFFGSKEKIAEAKGELLPRTNPLGFVVLNGDDPYVMSQKHKYHGEIFTYSLGNDTDIVAYELDNQENGTYFKIRIDSKSANCFIPLHGEHNVSNVLGAILIAYKMGIEMDLIVERLSTLSVSKMRFEKIYGPKGSILINDAYNASPTSMIKSVDTFLKIYSNKDKIVVLGDMFELGELTE